MITMTREQCSLTDEEFNGFGMWIVEFVKKTISPDKSNSAIRRDITSGAVRINDVVVTDDKSRIKFDVETSAWVLMLNEGFACRSDT